MIGETPYCRFVPGESYAVIGQSGCCITTERSLAIRLWPLIQTGADFAKVLGSLIFSGLTGLPDLMFLGRHGSGVVLLVRGDWQVVGQFEDGTTESWTGHGYATWLERSLSNLASIQVGRSDPATLPIASGVVPADGFTWAVTATDVVDTPELTPTSGLSIDTLPPIPVSLGAQTATTGPALSEQTAAPTSVVVPEPDSLMRRNVSDESTPHAEPELTLIPASSGDLEQDVAVESMTESVDTAVQSGVREPLEETWMPPVELPDVFEMTSMSDRFDTAARGKTGVLESLPDFVSDRASDSVVAMMPPERNDEAITDPTPTRQGDHDGRTIFGGELAALLAAAQDIPEAEPSVVSTSEIVLSTGQVVGLDRPVILGRRPEADRVSGADMPQLVAVPSPNQDISRSHLEIKTTTMGILASDLSTNGSRLIKLDGTIRELEFGRSMLVEPGDVIDLGDGVTAHIRHILDAPAEAAAPAAVQSDLREAL